MRPIAHNVQYYLHTWCHWITILADGNGSRLTLETRLPEDGIKPTKLRCFNSLENSRSVGVFG